MASKSVITFYLNILLISCSSTICSSIENNKIEIQRKQIALRACLNTYGCPWLKSTNQHAVEYVKQAASDPYLEEKTIKVTFDEEALENKALLQCGCCLSFACGLGAGCLASNAVEPITAYGIGSSTFVYALSLVPPLIEIFAIQDIKKIKID